MMSSLLRSEPHVLRRDGGVVDDHPGGLRAGPGRRGPDVIDAGGGCAGQHRHVVEQSYESTCHGRSFRSVGVCVLYR
jgi:hypothetical protein